ncbi:unnamed protein product, partial [Vitis vinifera]|uniref:Uncharacterized protein n=1 Tax=Vitis vinifera TaxID=29760 RepID=E0CVH0_VITVI
MINNIKKNTSLFTKPNQSNIIKKTQKFLPLSLPKYSPIKLRTSKQTNQIRDLKTHLLSQRMMTFRSIRLLEAMESMERIEITVFEKIRNQTLEIPNFFGFEKK